MRFSPEALKLVVVNVEGSKHLDNLIPFLRSERPHVALMQEVFGPDMPLFEQHLEAEGTHVPMYGRNYDGPVLQWGPKNYGVAILSRLPVVRTALFSYGYPTSERQAFQKVVAGVTVNHKGEAFDLSTIHFTWAPDGKPTQVQREDLERLLEGLGNHPRIFGGDFNAPRGGEIWSAIAARYKDNIPASITSTIDGKKHRAGDLQLVVDGLWTTPLYQVDNVKIQDGVSDHCAIVAEIRKVGSDT